MSADITPEGLTALATKAEAIKFKRWKANSLESFGHRGVFWVEVDDPRQISTVAATDPEVDELEVCWSMADAEFIAAADPETVLALVAEIQRLRSVVQS